MFFAAEEATRTLWEHPMVIAITAPLIVAFCLGVTAGIRRIVKLGNEILRRLDKMEGEIRNVKDDVGDVKNAVDAQEIRTSALDADLRRHMAEEARDRSEDRKERRGEIARVHGRIDDLVKRLLIPGGT